MKGLEKVPNLQEIDLTNNKITEIEALEGCAYLKKIYFGMNQITKISGLDECCQLLRLDLSRNKITTIEGLSALKELTLLALHDNPISHISGLAANEKLSGFSLSKGGFPLHKSKLTHPIFHKPNQPTKYHLGSSTSGMVLYCQWQEQPVISLIATYVHPLAPQTGSTI